MKIENVYFPNIPLQGITYYIGKNASDNFEIIDLSQPEDIWIHANNTSSCHVIAVIPEEAGFTKKQMMTIIKKGFSLCQQYTNKLINQKNTEFIYTKVKNIIKTEKNGEVVVTNGKKYVQK